MAGRRPHKAGSRSGARGPRGSRGPRSPRGPRGRSSSTATQKLIAGVVALIVALVAGISPVLSGNAGPNANSTSQQTASATSSSASSSASSSTTSSAKTLASIPEYTDSLTVFIGADDGHAQGTPSFSSEEIAEAKKGAFTSFGDLDSLGRCTAAFACLGPETLSYEPRESIQSVHPTGWHQAKYSFVSGESLYNRCHLIAHMLCGENANEKNLITGTRAMNTEGMEPFESQVDSYIEDTNNHVLYRVTPVFSGDELVARGVQIEAQSLEDDGAGLSLNVYCYNVQPGVVIDYATGENHAA